MKTITIIIIKKQKNKKNDNSNNIDFKKIFKKNENFWNVIVNIVFVNYFEFVKIIHFKLITIAITIFQKFDFVYVWIFDNNCFQYISNDKNIFTFYIKIFEKFVNDFDE